MSLSTNLNPVDAAYHSLLQELVTKAHRTTVRPDRTNTGTFSVFGRQYRYDLSQGQIPIITTKHVHMHSVLHELLWFISGSTNIKYLHDNKVSIWDEWADEHGELGPVYGSQWRSWEAPAVFSPDTNFATNEELDNEGEFLPGPRIDQIQRLLDGLKSNPFGRRHIVSAWNVADIDRMALPPCHTLFQFYVEDVDGVLTLSCQLYQRSCDVFLGGPFNIAQYGLLTHMIAAVLGYAAGEFVHTIGDAHLYSNHIAQAEEQLSRTSYDVPKIVFNRVPDNFFDFEAGDISFEYAHHPRIKAPVAV